MKSIQDIVVGAVVELLELGSDTAIGLDTLLADDLGMDSGLLLELFMLVEERIPGATLDPAEMTPEHFTSVASFADLVESAIKVRVDA